MSELARGYERVGPPVPGAGPILRLGVWAGELLAVRADGEGIPRVWVLRSGAWDPIYVDATHDDASGDRP